MPAKDKNTSKLEIIPNIESHKIYNNTTENEIRINESKARLIYNKHINKTYNTGLIWTFLGLFITCLIAVLTSDFKDIIGIENSKYYLFSMFVIGAIVFFIATIVQIAKWLRGRKKYNVDTFIADLKESEK